MMNEKINIELVMDMTFNQSINNEDIIINI